MVDQQIKSTDSLKPFDGKIRDLVLTKMPVKKKYNWEQIIEEKSSRSEEKSNDFDWKLAATGKIAQNVLKERLGEETYQEFLETVSRYGLASSEKFEMLDLEKK